MMRSESTAHAKNPRTNQTTFASLCQSERHIFFIILFFPRFDNKETIYFHSCFIYTHNPLKTSFYWSGNWTILERQIDDDFSQFQTSKSISEDIFAKWLKFLPSILQNICKRLRRAFLQFPAETRNMIFLVIFQKISEKKSASIFSKVGSKESQWNTDEKVGLRQVDILKF